MKKIIALVLALCLSVLCFAGCSSKGGDTLTVAISPDFAPMEFVDPTKEGQDKFVGFDVSMAKYFAEQMGKELVIQPMSFDACQTAVYTGSVDMAISGFSWTESRAENYNISDYYHAGENESNQILITLADNGDKFADVGTGAGLKVGAQTASLQESLVMEQLPDAELVTIGDLGTAILQLKNGDFDVLAVAEGNGEAIIASNPEVAKSGYYFAVDEKYTANVVLLQKGNDELTAKVNELIAKAEGEGLNEIWYAEAQAIAGIDVSFDDEGNEITG